MGNVFVFITGILILLSQSLNAQWTQINGRPGGKTYNTNVLAAGDNLFVGTHGGVFLSTNNGISWSAVSNGLTDSSIQCLAVNGGNIFAGTNSKGVFLSTNNGISWSAVSNGLTDSSIQCLAVNGSNIFAGTNSKGVFLSTNNGISWSAVNSGLKNLHVNSFVVSGNSIFTIFIGIDSSTVYLSTNNGTNWIAINTKLPPYFVFTGLLTASGNDLFTGAISIVDANGGLLTSTNNGTNWTKIGSGLPGGQITALVASGNNLFVGAYYPGMIDYGAGVYLSTDNGISCTAFNSGMPSNIVIGCIAVTETYIFASTIPYGAYGSTDSGTVWRRPLSDVIQVSTQKSMIPIRKFAVSVNNMLLKYTIPAASDVSVKIFDLKGRLVFSTIIPRQSAGSHSLPLAARGLSSGSYVLDFNAGAYKVCKTIMVHY